MCGHCGCVDMCVSPSVSVFVRGHVGVCMSCVCVCVALCVRVQLAAIVASGLPHYHHMHEKKRTTGRQAVEAAYHPSIHSSDQCSHHMSADPPIWKQVHNIDIETTEMCCGSIHHPPHPTRLCCAGEWRQPRVAPIPWTDR
mmetsp:Transcript_51197/g.128547  ORF Transcript_51197/g.128547 Transcript_51197/m.128547 type:complete len:141 (+) Transcript_51197:578-1000(+)